MTVKADANEPEALRNAILATPDSRVLSVGKVHVACSPAVYVMVLGQGTHAVFRKGRQLSRAVLSLEQFAGDFAWA